MTALVPPRLDDRSYEELRTELIRRIPVHSQEWTARNDAGIVLLELFAWLTENALYRMNRMPEKATLEFLRLLNIALRPAQVARTMVRLDLPPGEIVPETVPFGGAEPRLQVAAGEATFQVLNEVQVLPLQARGFIKRRGPNVTAALPGLADVKALLEQHLGAATALPVATYETIAMPLAQNGLLPPPTALADAVDRNLWIALLSPEPLVANQDDAQREATLARLRREISGQVVSFGVRVDNALCGATDHHRCPDPGTDPPRQPLIWEIATGGFVGAMKRVDRVRYDRLEVHQDATQGFLTNGVVRLDLPPAARDGTPALGTWRPLDFDQPDPDLLGLGDLPPLIDDDLTVRVVTWIRCRRPESQPDPRIRHLDINMVEVEQAVTAAGELLGYGNGRPRQVFRLARTPVIRDSVVVQVRQGGDWVAHRLVDDLAQSLPNDPHCQLDPESGEITFGDGINGRFPRPGELVRCLSYRAGGGARGNVPAEAINQVTSRGRLGELTVTHPFAATLGRDGETVEAARRRIPDVLRHRDRAVAHDDFQKIALETPGVHVGRVEVLPRHKPHERVGGVPGVITLVVLPAYDPLRPDQPTPDREMLRRVCAHLEPRRLVTTELYVTPPEYVPVWISVAVDVEPEYGVATVRRWVELAIQQFLAPLMPYGPKGHGWPLGREVQPRDVEAAVLRVEGVRLVFETLLGGTEIGIDGSYSQVGGRVRLREWQLPVVLGVQVTTDETAESIDRVGDPAAPPPPDTGPPLKSFPLPVEREVC